MDTVLGVSMAPTAVRMVLVEGENADGATVDEEGFDVTAADAPTLSGADQVVSAILGTQEGAAESGYQLRSTGVTWTDPTEAAALRDALAARKVENVMLVSAFLAAAALAQAVGSSVGYAQTGLLFVEPDTATLAVVNTADGSITDVHRQPLPPGSDPVAELSAMASSAETLETRPDGLFVVGSGVDIAPIKARVEAATSLMVNAPEEPETALARGAALASANAPLFSSSTAALAYAQDPGTGAIDPIRGRSRISSTSPPTARPASRPWPTAQLPDEDADAHTALVDDDDLPTGTYTGVSPAQGDRRPFVLVVSAVAAIFVVGVAALLVALAIGMRPTAAVRPDPGHQAVAPVQPAPAAPPAPAPAAAPAPAPAAPAPAPAAPAPEPAAPAPRTGGSGSRTGGSGSRTGGSGSSTGGSGSCTGGSGADSDPNSCRADIGWAPAGTAARTMGRRPRRRRGSRRLGSSAAAVGAPAAASAAATAASADMAASEGFGGRGF